jgi:hypothetical protein
MIDDQEKIRIQVELDRLAEKYDSDEAQRKIAREIRTNLAPIIREDRAFLARSRESAGHRVIR